MQAGTVPCRIELRASHTGKPFSCFSFCRCEAMVIVLRVRNVSITNKTVPGDCYDLKDVKCGKCHNSYYIYYHYDGTYTYEHGESGYA